MRNYIENELTEARDLLNQCLENHNFTQQIEAGVKLLVNAFQNGNKVLTCGNGGSHCDAMHFAEELTGRYRNNRPALPAIAISDPSHLSCVSNDYGFEYVFSRFVEGVGQKNDILVGISTSGNSKNIIRAIEAAQKKGMKTLLLLGKDGGKLKDKSDVEIIVPHFGYADRIQEIHIKIIHIFILLIEKQLGYSEENS